MRIISFIIFTILFFIIIKAVRYFFKIYKAIINRQNISFKKDDKVKHDNIIDVDYEEINTDDSKKS